MAGFDSVGSTSTMSRGTPQAIPAGYGISPPHVSPVQSSGYMNVSAPSPRQIASPYQAGMATSVQGADTSPQHEANVELSRLHFGDFGFNSNDYGGYADVPGFPNQTNPANYNAGNTVPNYGLPSTYWNQVNQYLTNPQNPTYGTEFRNLSDRLFNAFQSSSPWNNPYGLNQDQLHNLAVNLPTAMSMQYGMAPPAILQNVGVPNWNLASGMRMF